MKAQRIPFSEVGNYDRYIETLMKGQLLTENEIKIICEKVNN